MLRQDPVQAATLAERRLTPQEKDEAQKQVQDAPFSVEAARAKYLLGVDQAARGDWKAAGEQWQKVVKEHPGSGWDRLSQYKIAVALEQLGDPARAFVQYQAQLSGTAIADLPERSRAACLRLANSMDAEALRGLIAYPAAGEFQSPLRLRLMELDLAAGHLDAVRQGLNEYMKLYPAGPGLDRVEALNKRIEVAVPVEKTKLGLFLPQSGPLADFSAQVKRGIDLALQQANAGKPEAEQFKLLIADEAGNSATVQEALRHLVEDEKVIGILGPLGSDSAAQALPYLTAQRVPVISPTAARPDLANASPWFFRNCMTPEKQAASMADFAVVDRKLTRVASLVSDKAYSQALARAFAARFAELGGQVVVQVSYTAGSNDFKGAMLGLGGLDPGEGKNAEQEEKREQLARVEEASTALGRYLLEQAAQQALPQGVTLTPRLRVLVLDFAEDEATKGLNAGRAFADRFARTLGQLDELEVLGPQQAEKALHDRSLDTDHLSPQQVADLAKTLNAAFVLGGGTAEIPLDPKADAKEQARYAKARWFNVVAQVIDPAKAEIAASRRFQFSKYKAPPSNPLGLQAIYVPASAADVAQLVPSLRFYDLKTPLLGSDLWDQPELARHLGELEGACFSTGFWADSTRSEVQRFTQAYKVAYAAKPGLLTAQAYDAATLMLDAIGHGASDRSALREALSKRDLEGVSGRTTFDGAQDAKKRLPIIQIEQGQLKEMTDK